MGGGLLQSIFPISVLPVFKGGILVQVASSASGFEASMFAEYCAQVSQLQKQCVAHHQLRIFLLLLCCFETNLLLSTGCHNFFALCFLRIGSKVQLFFLFKLTLFFGRSHFQLLKLGWRVLACDPSFSLQPIARVAPDT